MQRTHVVKHVFLCINIVTQSGVLGVLGNLCSVYCVQQILFASKTSGCFGQFLAGMCVLHPVFFCKIWKSRYILLYAL